LTGWHLSRATPADIEPLLKLENRCFSLPWGRLSFEGEMAGPSGDGFVVRLDAADGREAIIAYAFTRFIADEVHIFRIAVAPEWRRRGIGSRLLAECLRSARSQGMSSALLEARPSNTEALSFYAKLGFQVVAARPGYYSDNREEALILKREIKEIDL
jgi:[ribosomal protein S18]-alanine N-acetyltransferase